MTGNTRLALTAIIFLLCSPGAPGATLTWTGGSTGMLGANNSWSDARNWSPNAVPAAGDDLVLHGGAQPTSENTIAAGTTFNTISVTGHLMFGNAIALNAGLTADDAQISLDSIKLNTHQTFTATTANNTVLITSGIDLNGKSLRLDGDGNHTLVGAISGGAGIITKSGSGVGTLTGPNSYSGFTVAQSTGVLQIFGSQPGSAVDIEGGLLGGGGTVGPVFVRIADATLAPGAVNNGTAVLTVSGNLTFFQNQGTLAVDLKGTSVGSGYDQVKIVNGGAVDLSTGSTLAVTVGSGFTPSPGDSFVIINNEGASPVQGSFENLPEGSFFNVGNTTFFITYKGGDGNDVALHVPTIRTWDGGGANANWRTAANWVGDIAPNAGDDLVFPAGAARLSNTNNFPAGTKFNSISLSGSYILGGNAIVLQAGITSTGNASNSVNLSEIKLDANQSITKSGQGDLIVRARIDTNGKTLTLLSATDAGTHRYSGIISGAGGVNMAALNTAILEGSLFEGTFNTYTGPTVISSGILTVTASQSGSPVQMTGGRLRGGGELGPLTASGGTINPGTGALGIGGNLSLNSDVTVLITFDRHASGVVVGGRLDVAGSVDLGGSTLLVRSSFAAPQTGDQITMISNDGTDPVVGTFGSLPEGASFAVGSATVQISYQGGDGNDVILRVTAVAPVGIGLIKLTNGTDNDAPPGPAVPVGSTVTFTYVVTNTASTPLHSFLVRDDNGTPDIPSDDFNASFSGGDTNSNGLLEPGETFIFTASRVATEGQHTNIGEAKAIGENFGPLVTASNPDNHFGGTPPSSLANISTRLRVQAGDNALIGGVIATGTTDKKVIVRAIGPTLANFGLSGVLQDPTLELFQGNLSIASNDDWVSSSQMTEIQSSGLAPGNNAESAIIATLMPNQNYTAVVRGKDGQTGVGVVEVFDVDPAAPARLANISSRGFVDVDDNVMIAGLIVAPTGGTNINVLVRALGPTLGDFGVQGFLANPTLDLVGSNGTVIRSNQDWKDLQRAAIEAAQLAPAHDAEAALIESLAPGAYTAVVRGLNRTTGVGLVEVYNIP